MAKFPILSSILIGLAAGVATIGISRFVTSDWPLPPDMTNMLILGLIVAGVVGRCVHIALVPDKKAVSEPR